MTAMKNSNKKVEPLRCPACGVLCSDIETLNIHKKFCKKMPELREKEGRLFAGRTWK